jgi:hypothetical protein
MAKYSKDLDSKFVTRVRQISTEFPMLSEVKIEPIRLIKGNTYGEVMKANELTQLFTGEENVVAVALYEELFDKLDENVQNILIRNLLEQINVEESKDGMSIKVKIEKPQLNLGLETYHLYGDIATQALEGVLLILDQMAEQEREMKELAKQEKARNKKSKKKGF